MQYGMFYKREKQSMVLVQTWDPDADVGSQGRLQIWAKTIYTKLAWNFSVGPKVNRSWS